MSAICRACGLRRKTLTPRGWVGRCDGPQSKPCIKRLAALRLVALRNALRVLNQDPAQGALVEELRVWARVGKWRGYKARATTSEPAP